MANFRYTIKGIVQGVGFRPYIYKKCVEKGARGYVKNTGNGVEIISDIEIDEIFNQIPKNAKIEKISKTKFTSFKRRNFKIIETNRKDKNAFFSIPPDLDICQNCLIELNDPQNRRYKYHFISCTHCGPRYSMLNKNPYDRNNTSMNEFSMCEKCKNDYMDTENRRFHAETTACEKCGPAIALNDTEEFMSEINGYDAIKKASDLINNGEIIAIKGVGGFHWVCKPEKEVVMQLRKLNKRPNKPFALMVKDLEMAKSIVEISDEEEEMLASSAKPIVVLKKLSNNPDLEHKYHLAGKFVSELSSLGIMLPYSATHYMIFKNIDYPLIYTSANTKGNPITYRKDQQQTRFILSHQRTITNPVDDSVVKVINKNPVFIRRSRGFVPYSFSMPESLRMKLHTKQILALGAEMNSSVSVFKDGKIWVSEYIGDTKNLDTFDYFKRKTRDFLKLLNCKPGIVLCDKHPLYNTSNYAEDLADEFDAKLYKVQHHKAHLAGAYLENYPTLEQQNKKKYEFIGIAADGTGLGDDDSIWGGECLHFNDGKFDRIGSNDEFKLIGGESAVRDYKKLGLGMFLKYFPIDNVYEILEKVCPGFNKNNLEVLIKMHEEDFNCFKTSSTGRILDAISFILGLKEKRTYEGEGAIFLESEAVKSEINELPIEVYVSKFGDLWRISYKNLIEFIIMNMYMKKEDLAKISLLYIAQGFKELLGKSDNLEGLPCVFSGGVAQNSIITSFLMDNKILTHKNIPPSDGGISFGQIALFALSN